MYSYDVRVNFVFTRLIVITALNFVDKQVVKFVEEDNEILALACAAYQAHSRAYAAHSKCVLTDILTYILPYLHTLLKAPLRRFMYTVFSSFIIMLNHLRVSYSATQLSLFLMLQRDAKIFQCSRASLWTFGTEFRTKKKAL